MSKSFKCRSPEALLPANDGRRCGLELLLDRAKGHAVGQHQNQLGAKYISRQGRVRDWRCLLSSECCCSGRESISLPVAMPGLMLAA